MTELRPPSYVGIDGVSDRWEFAGIVDIALQAGMLNSRQFVEAGVMASDVTIAGGSHNDQDWFLRPDELQDAAANDDSGLTRATLHFETNPALLPDVFQRSLALAMESTMQYRRGIQFEGLPWMDDEYGDFYCGERQLLYKLSRRYRSQSLVLHADTAMLQANRPDAIASRLLVLPADYVVLELPADDDGEPVPQVVRPFIQAIYDTQLPTSVTIAGGLNSENLPDVYGPLAADFPGLSCAAQESLRDWSGEVSVLDMGKVQRFIATWREIVPLEPSSPAA